MKSITLCLLAMVSIGAYGQTVPIKQSGSGFVTASFAAGDVAENQTGGSSWSASHGSLGAANHSGWSLLEEWDGVTFCDFVDGAPQGVLLGYEHASFIDRAANGDLLYRVMSNSPPSTLCFNFIDNVSSTFEVYTDITGGTGQFEGNGGTVVATGSAQIVAEGHTAIEFKMAGQIEK